MCDVNDNKNSQVHKCSVVKKRRENMWVTLGRQRAKKVVSDSLGLVDFAIGQVNFVFNLPDGQVMLFEEFE